MAKDTALSFRVPAAIKGAIEQAAKDDDRSISSLVERILKEWLKAKGYLSSFPDRMIEHDGDGLIIIDEGEGEPFDLSVETTEAARKAAKRKK